MDRCGSTNTELLAMNLAHGMGLATREQTGGRGRLGRTWVGEPGNLFLSVVWRQEVSPALLPLITLGAGCVLAEAVGHGLKWPNDLLDAQGRKLAGILAEADWERGTLRQVVVGFGVNLVHAPEGAACVAGWTREVLADVLCAGVEALDLSTVRQRWLACNLTLGRTVSIGEIRGVAEDLDTDGALLVNTGVRIERVITGDLGFP